MYSKWWSCARYSQRRLPGVARVDVPLFPADYVIVCQIKAIVCHLGHNHLKWLLYQRPSKILKTFGTTYYKQRMVWVYIYTEVHIVDMYYVNNSNSEHVWMNKDLYNIMGVQCSSVKKLQTYCPKSEEVLTSRHCNGCSWSVSFSIVCNAFKSQIEVYISQAVHCTYKSKH